MQVILIQNVHRLGVIGDVVNVKGGYARNFLIPREVAVPATKKNIAEIEQRKAELEKENQQRREAAEKLAGLLNGKKIILIRQAGEDGRLFGSVTPRDVSRSVCEDEKSADVKQVVAVLDTPIKFLGIYNVKAQLHPEVFIEVSVNVARNEAEALEAEAEALKPKKEKKAEEQPEAGNDSLEAAIEQADLAAEEADTSKKKKAKKEEAKAEASEDAPAAEAGEAAAE